MRYHNITKDDMLNGDGLKSYCGYQDVTTVVRNVTIRSPGTQTADLCLMKRQKKNYLRN